MKTKKQTQELTQGAVAYSQLGQDLKHSVLIVSVLVNMVLFTAWIALQVTPRFDSSVARVLFG